MNTGFQSTAYIYTIESASVSGSGLLLNSHGLDQADIMTVFTPALTGASASLQVMPTSGSSWYPLYDANGSQVTVLPSTATVVASPAAYAYKFVSEAAEAADREITVIGAYSVNIRGLPSSDTWRV